jgi:poly[(R)-3-hydroxyalkanoate] polymerase subunit PhaC
VCEIRAVDLVDLQYAIGLSRVDPAALGKALVETSLALARRPGVIARRAVDLALSETAVAIDVARLAFGDGGDPVAVPAADDRRFADRAWRDNAALRGVLGSYVVTARVARRVLDDASVSDDVRRKARVALDAALDALAPSNVPWLNPRVVKELYDTGGRSALLGLANVLDDVLRNRGRPRQFDASGFEVGSTLAATPGRVVHRNDLIELIAYEPQAETVFAQPVLYSPAWINKYYVLDLAPGRSFIEHAVRSGLTVFAISYRNPDDSMAGLRLDDYLRDGLLEALDVTATLTGSDTVNLVSVCIGATLAAIALGVLAARGQGDRVGWATINVGLVDFADPGGAGAFTDAAAIERMARQTSKQGFFSGEQIAGPFNMMRTTEFFWNYVVSNWYMGRKPAPFDILAWNADQLRLPARMHAEFLRACYLENRLATPGTFEIDRTPVDVTQVRTPLYVLGAETDHIAPWRSVYRATQLVPGDHRFVLTAGGHIAGMVNPPGSPKAVHFVADTCPADPDEWLVTARRVEGSWWDDWIGWATARSGPRVPPPELPEGEPAPGSYVHG